MKITLPRLALAAAAPLLALTLIIRAGDAPVAVTAGPAAPAFSLVDTHGKTHALADFKGKYVVLEWTNYDCPYVKKHYSNENMQKLQKEYTGKGVVWLSINSSAPGKQGNFAPDDFNDRAKKQNVASSAILLDPEGKVGRAYGAKTTPHMYVIDPKGKLIYAGAIDDTPSADSADIATSKNYVRMALDEAMAGKAVTVASSKPYGCGVKYKS